MKYRFKAKRADTDEYTPYKHQFVEGYYIEVKPFNGDTIPYIITDLNDEIEVLRDTVELINNPLEAENNKLEEKLLEAKRLFNSQYEENIKLGKIIKTTVRVPRELSEDDIHALCHTAADEDGDYSLWAQALTGSHKAVVEHFTKQETTDFYNSDGSLNIPACIDGFVKQETPKESN